MVEEVGTSMLSGVTLPRKVTRDSYVMQLDSLLALICTSEFMRPINCCIFHRVRGRLWPDTLCDREGSEIVVFLTFGRSLRKTNSAESFWRRTATSSWLLSKNSSQQLNPELQPPKAGRISFIS